MNGDTQCNKQKIFNMDSSLLRIKEKYKTFDISENKLKKLKVQEEAEVTCMTTEVKRLTVQNPATIQPPTVEPFTSELNNTMHKTLKISCFKELQKKNSHQASSARIGSNNS